VTPRSAGGLLTRRAFLRAGSAAMGAGLITVAGAGQASGSYAAPLLARGNPLDELRAMLKGPLLLPGDPFYDAAYEPANGRYRDIRPMAIALCADERDIVTCVQWSNRNGVPPVVRGGGHSYAGYSTTHGLLVNIGSLNTVRVDTRTGLAVTGGAALNADLFRATADSALFLPGGTCLGVGVGGLTLGGGIGYNTHWAGLTSDHLRASRIVVASGDVLDIDDTDNSDLFWACRGGAGGSFGINTSFTFELAQAPQANVGYYRFDWRGADAAGAVLSTFHTILQHAPAGLNAVVMAQATPVGPGGPREAIAVMSRGQYIGPIGELRELVAPLLTAATPSRTTLTELPFWDMQRIWVSLEGEQHSFGDISRYAPAPVPDSVIGKFVDLLVACPSRSAAANGSIWSLGWIGGDVVNSFGRTDTAYVHRNMLTLLRPTTVWEDDAPPSVGEGLIAWTDDVVAAMAPYVSAESYQNFPNRRITDWQSAYYAENFDRLVDVKTRYDVDNLFNNAQSIPSRGPQPAPARVPVVVG